MPIKPKSKPWFLEELEQIAMPKTPLVGGSKILAVFDRINSDPEIDRFETIIQRVCEEAGIKPHRLCIALLHRIQENTEKELRK